MASFREDAAENQALQESVRGQTSPPRTGSSTASSLFGRISGGEGGVDSYNTGEALTFKKDINHQNQYLK